MKYDHIDSDYKPKYDQEGYSSEALLYKKYNDSKHSVREKLKHCEEYINRHKIHSQKVTIRENKLTEKINSMKNKDKRDKLLKITFKEPNKNKNKENDGVIYIMNIVFIIVHFRDQTRRKELLS